jgi:uncharacterized DUF497 family protein
MAPGTGAVDAGRHAVGDQMRLEHEDVFAEGESRNIVIGRVEDVLLAAVYSTPEDDLYRIISARPSTAHERKEYERNIFHP